MSDLQLSQIETFSEDHLLRVLIETPRGSRNKYDWVEELGVFRMSKVLPEGHVFPFDFGFIPGTRGEDGDPLDVLVLSDVAIGFPGTLVETRLIGVIEADQTERDGKTVKNDRLIGVAEPSRLFQGTKRLADLPKSLLEEIEAFFVSYNEQSGKKFKPSGHGTAATARRLIQDAKP
jgi:inorganic pyrophosphatase